MPKARRNKRHTVLERKYRLTCIISSHSFWKVPLLSSHWMWDIMVVGPAIGRISWECSKCEKGLLFFFFLIFKCLCQNTLLWAELWPLSCQILWSWQALWCPYIFLKLYELARSLSLPLLPWSPGRPRQYFVLFFGSGMEEVLITSNLQNNPDPVGIFKTLREQTRVTQLSQGLATNRWQNQHLNLNFQIPKLRYAVM